MSQADDKAAQLIEYIRCAKVNFDNFEKSLSNRLPLYNSVHYRIAKHQLCCAEAIANGQPEPEVET